MNGSLREAFKKEICLVVYQKGGIPPQKNIMKMIQYPVFPQKKQESFIGLVFRGQGIPTLHVWQQKLLFPVIC